MPKFPPDDRQLRQRLRAPGPKRILSLDGGGTRGIVTIAFLERLEEALCGTNPSGCLSDHFDLIGGTSTGAIIAAALALGWRVARIRAIYEDFAASVFRRSWYRISPLVNRYDARKLEHLLASHFGRTANGEEILLGSPELLTGFAVVAKRLDTGSPWVVSNIPWSPFHADRGGPNGNWRIPLRNLVRASAAAPTFFQAVSLPMGPKADGKMETGRFVDGGASPYNNPAMRLFELARLGCFGLRWTPGKENMLIVSIGTGRFRTRDEMVPFKIGQSSAWVQALPQRLLMLQALRALTGMIGDGANHALRSLQALGYSPLPVVVDGEVGDLRDDLLGTEPLFTVLRYDLDLDALVADGKITAQEALAFRQIDAPDQMRHLARFAAEAASQTVDPAHLHLPGLPQTSS